MLLHLLYGDLPSLDGVTLLAVGAQLAAVDVGVAVSAPGAHVREYGLGVALLAVDAFVHATQGKFRAVVIEFRNSSDRFPSRNGVAVLARNIQIAVRTARGGIRLRLPALPPIGRQ